MFVEISWNIFILNNRPLVDCACVGFFFAQGVASNYIQNHINDVFADFIRLFISINFFCASPISY